MPAMKGTLASLGLCALSALAALAPTQPSHAADVRAARVWADANHTRMVFDLSGPLSYTINQHEDDIILDLRGSRADDAFDTPAAKGLYKGLTESRQGGTLRLVTHAQAGAHPKTFLLKPDGDAGYRLVLDLYPGQNDAASMAAAVHMPAVDTTVAASIPSTASSKAARSSVLSIRQAAELLKGDRKVIVAVDAGHGGEDPGAHGPDGTLEKNVTLAVARELAAQINKQPGMKAVLTRSGDYFVPLKRRYQIAREQNADMFVSVHADAFKSGDAKGSSVWVLSPRGKTSEAARWLADRENRADLIGGVSLDDKDDSLAAVLLDLQQGYAMQASDAIAGNVLKALGALGPTHRGYVERANFVVLRSPDVPSILVETAFISNPQEERKLRDPGHQQRLAAAVMGGVKNYFENTPPPGTWFAAQAAQRSGVLAAVAPSPTTETMVQAATGSAMTKVADNDQPDARADADVRDLHRVGSGESLRSIARQYGVSVGALKSANRINSDSVHAGVVLAIPAG
jgi:N-acetylmuramoyl-L-alanine amidase